MTERENEEEQPLEAEQDEEDPWWAARKELHSEREGGTWGSGLRSASGPRRTGFAGLRARTSPQHHELALTPITAHASGSRLLPSALV